jgi:hypothetical protein
MKEFFKEVEEARDLADKIDVKINEVKKLQNDILSSPKVRITWNPLQLQGTAKSYDILSNSNVWLLNSSKVYGILAAVL